MILVKLIILFLILFIVVLAGIVLFSPIQARLKCSFRGKHGEGDAQCFFLHPKVLRVFVTISTRKIEIRIFGKTIEELKKKRRSSKTISPTYEDESSTVNEEKDTPPVQSSSVSSDKESERSAAEIEQSHSVETYTSDTSGTSGEETSHHALLQKRSSTFKWKKVRPVVKKELKTDKRQDEKQHRDTAFSNTDTTDTSASEKLEKFTTELKEKVVAPWKKIDNLLKKLKQHIVVYFLSNYQWRTKIVHWLIRFFKQLLSLVRFDQLHIFIRAGVENPMVVGVLSGCCHSIRSVLTGKDKALFLFEPVFMENTCSGSISFRGKTSLFTICFPIVFSVITFPFVETLLVFLRYRRMKSKKNG